jgi:hypothetical protein
VRVLPQMPQTQDQDNKITQTGPESGFELMYRKRVCGKANDCCVKRTAKNGDSA